MLCATLHAVGDIHEVADIHEIGDLHAVGTHTKACCFYNTATKRWLNNKLRINANDISDLSQVT
jgi:hypothetical protein